MAVPHVCHSSQRLSTACPLVRSKLCGLLKLLEPKGQPVAVRPVLDPVRPIDQLSRDSLEPELEEQAMMRFEQPVGNMDWEIGVDLRWVPKGHVVDFGQRQAIRDHRLALIARLHRRTCGRALTSRGSDRW
jgi:hypothetical protein